MSDKVTVETGVVRFGDDAQGAFIAGGDCERFFERLEVIVSEYEARTAAEGGPQARRMANATIVRNYMDVLADAKDIDDKLDADEVQRFHMPTRANVFVLTPKDPRSGTAIVKLDGERVRFCKAACEAEGWVDRYVRVKGDHGESFALDANDEPVVERARGKVTIEYPAQSVPEQSDAHRKEETGG